MLIRFIAFLTRFPLPKLDIGLCSTPLVVAQAVVLEWLLGLIYLIAEVLSSLHMLYQCNFIGTDSNVF